jgi:hypothetical protein
MVKYIVTREIINVRPLQDVFGAHCIGFLPVFDKSI